MARLYFSTCTCLIGKMFLCCDKDHKNLKPRKIRKVKTQSVIFELGTVSSPEHEHEEY